MDIFSWSLPFLADKIGEMMDSMLRKNSIIPKKQLALTKTSSDIDFEKIMTDLRTEKKQQEEQKINKIRAKVLTIGRMARMFKNAREHSELLTQAKMVSSDGKLPQGLLIKNLKEIKSDVNQFLALKKLDSENEKFPVESYRKS